MLCSPVFAVGIALISAVTYASPLGSPRRDATAHKSIRNLVVFGDSFSDSGKSFKFYTLFILHTSLPHISRLNKLSLTELDHEQGTRTVPRTIPGLLTQRTTKDGSQTALCGWNTWRRSLDWNCIIMHSAGVSYLIESNPWI